MTGKDFRKKYLGKNNWNTFEWDELKADAIKNGSKFFDNWTDIDSVPMDKIIESITKLGLGTFMNHTSGCIYYYYADDDWFYGFTEKKLKHMFLIPLIWEDGILIDIFSKYENENIDRSVMDSSRCFEKGMDIIWKNVVEDVIKSLPKVAG